jgi:hypothetical protein
MAGERLLPGWSHLRLENLEDVNARLRDKGMREIDPSDPQMAARYGLTATAQDTVEEEIQG